MNIRKVFVDASGDRIGVDAACVTRPKGNRLAEVESLETVVEGGDLRGDVGDGGGLVS